MPAKAPRIPNEIWDQHREEIIACYLAPNSGLEQTMSYIGEKYGFRPSKNQYNAKFKSWDINKNVPGGAWVSVASKKRKRSQEGKDSIFAFYGQKYTRQKVNKEIARHVPSRLTWCSSENAVLPDYITVSTPPTESTAGGISRELLLQNLPWYRFQQEIQTLVSTGLQRSMLQSTTDNPLVLATQAFSSLSDSDLPILWIGPDPQSELHTYLPPDDMETRSSSTGKLRTPQKNSPSSALKVFLQRFIFLSTNSLLEEWHFDKICDYIVGRCGGADILVFLCRLRSASIKVFARNVLRYAIGSGDLRLATRVIQCGAQLPNDPSQSRHWAKYLSSAVYHKHEPMVELLCKAGVPPKVGSSWSSFFDRNDWDSCVPILQTLLAFGADPESFITNEKSGYPLIAAASCGSLRVVELLLNAGARVDHYPPLECGTALQAAVSGGHSEVAKYLIQSGADVNVPNGQVVQFSRNCSCTSCFHGAKPFLTTVQLATKANHLSLLHVLLAHGASATACPISTHPNLERICRRRSTASNMRRLWNGISPYQRDDPHTGLQYGVLNRNLDIVALLLSIGVCPDSRLAPGVGDTPLQMSARLGYFELCQLLLSKGADVNAAPADYNGRTAVQGAAESGSWDILCLLQSAGAQINAPAGAEMGMTALQAACLNGNSLMVGFLLAHQADLNAAPSSLAGLTTIQATAMHGKIGLIRELIGLGAVVDAPATKMGTTALQAATKHKNLPLLKLLVQHGANVNATGDYVLRSPLEQAARGNWLEGAKFLLEHGANVNDTPFELPLSDEYDDDGYGDHLEYEPELCSPLGWAIYNQAEKMIQILLKYGADVLARAMFNGIDSFNALVYALMEFPSFAILNLLLEHVQELENCPGWENALKIVLEFSDEFSNHVDFNVCELIIEKTSSLSAPLRHDVIQKGWNALPPFRFRDKTSLLGMIRLLMKSGADLDSRADDGSTLLQRLARECSRESCWFLVDRGAAVNAHAAQESGTPLQEAIKWRNIKTANLLLEHGADVNALPAENRGVTALQAASINGMFDMVLRLLECGADVSAPAGQKDGRTAIDGAAERGYRDMVQLLLNAYPEQEHLGPVCNQAADYAEGEGHCEIAEWLRGYSVV